MYYIFSYDISHEKRLKHVSKYLETVGERAQYSVFICELNRIEFLEVTHNLRKMINVKEDSVLVIPVIGQTLANTTWIGVKKLEFHERNELKYI